MDIKSPDFTTWGLCKFNYNMLITGGSSNDLKIW